MRARDHGIVLGRLGPGPFNAITDVAGVRVGHATLIRGDGPRVVGQGPVRTGVTVVVPHDGDAFIEPVFAGCHRLNGNGELTGLEWVRESGLLTSPIAITNTHSVGVVHDALLVHAVRAHGPHADFWSLPVVGETYDGVLNDINGFHVRPEHLDAALAAASGGAVAEGSVGGGTGMICHEFKGGIGTASRVVPADAGGFTVGALVQANYGSRELLRIDGVPIGEAIPTPDVPSPWDAAEAQARARASEAIGDRATGAATGGAPGRDPAAPAAWRQARARSSWSWPPMRRCSRTSASGSPSAPASGLRGWAGSAPPARATSSSHSQRATAACRDRRPCRRPRRSTTCGCSMTRGSRRSSRVPWRRSRRRSSTPCSLPSR